MEKYISYTDIFGIVVGFTAFFVGIKFPDWDFKLKLKHRNILTHSPLATFGIIFLYTKSESELARFFLIGFSMGMGLHFIFDLFPKKWTWGALLHLPLGGISLRPTLSKTLFNIFVLTSFFIVIIFTKSKGEFLTLYVAGIVVLIKDMQKERKLFRPLLAFTIFFLLFGVIKYPELFSEFKFFLKPIFVNLRKILDFGT